ncbi:MAG: CpsD/CapB family tyrosine-protein kinase [Clostridia bacterium]|nr:CpsD/CapB family tyrosine-protein kinase [Clostridia bacterium]
MNNSKKNVNTIDFNPEEMLVCYNKEFGVVEAYKSIRTNIMYSMPKTDCGKAIVLTSATASEGKTTTVINLALTFAQVNAKVLIIDCDLRKPKIHRYLRIERKDGLSNVLCGFIELDNAIKVGVKENLDVLTSGEVPPNPAELLQTDTFASLVKELKKRYDYIFLDTPPINIVTDSVFPIKLSEGAILLSKKDYTTYDMVEQALEKMQRADANVIGTILIDNKENDNINYYKKSKYGYRYKE